MGRAVPRPGTATDHTSRAPLRRTRCCERWGRRAAELAAEAELADMERSGVPVPGPTAELLRTLSHTLDGLDLLDTGPQTAYARVKTAAQVQSVMKELRELAVAAGAERNDDVVTRLGFAS